MNDNYPRRRSTLLLSCAAAMLLPLYACAEDSTTYTARAEKSEDKSVTESVKETTRNTMDRAGDAASDMRMHLALEAKLAETDQLSALAINTDVKDGVARLEGEVERESQRELATEIAASVDGVTAVNNELRVTGEQANLGDRISEGLSDAALTAKVKSRLLASENTSGLAIDVDSSDDTVTLSGEVESETERELAVTIAANTAGVKDVRDNLSIDRD